MTKKKQVFALIIILINVVLLLSIAIYMLTSSEGYANQFQTDSRYPALSIDEEDNAQIHFISGMDFPNEYNEGFVEISDNGKIIDGPRFIQKSSEGEITNMNQNEIIDINGNMHIFRTSHDIFETAQLSEHNNVSIYYSKYDPNGTLLIENRTISSHFKVDYPESDLLQINGIKLRLDSKSNIHVVWYLSFSNSNKEIKESYYLKLDNNGNILVSKTKLYVFDSNILYLFIAIFVTIPCASIIIYILIAKKVSISSNIEYENNEQK